MPSIQTSYTPQLAIAFAGMVADMRNRTVLSHTSQSPGSIPYGSVVMRSTSDNGCLNIGDPGAGAFLGVAILDPTIRPQVGAVTNAYGPADIVAVLIKGAVWVTVGSPVTAGAPAYYTPAGVITSVGAGNTAIPMASFESSAPSGGLAKLRIIA